MRISAVTPYYQNYQCPTPTKPSFSGIFPVQTIKHLNIGMAEDGIIGKVRVFDSKGRERFLNVVKDTGPCGNEIYMLKDNIGNIIGEMIMRIVKYADSAKSAGSGDGSWVWVEYLRNYSRPGTKWSQDYLCEHKSIGTRLIQIAQRRSDEAMCGGNIHLCSKDSSKSFYEQLGFKEIPTLYDYKQNDMYLPADAKEPLSRLKGGL